MRKHANVRVIVVAASLVACNGEDENDAVGFDDAGDAPGDVDGGQTEGPGDGGDDGDDGGDDGDDGGDDGDDGGDGSDDAPADDGSVDDGGSFDCDIVTMCHDGTPVAGAGLHSLVPIGCGGGGFTTSQTINVASYADPEAPRSIPLLGDFDGDGALDLVVNFRKASTGFVFAGDGNGRFVEPPAAALAGGIFAGGWGGDLGDIDGDGNLDVMFGDHTRGARAWLGGGNMTFTEARTGLPDNDLFSGGGLADLDGDGNLDALFGADQFHSGVQHYRGGGNGTWTSATPPALSASNLGHFVFGDHDGDGDLDVFAFGKSGPGVTVFVLSNEGGSFSQIGQYSGGTSPLGADPLQGAVGDIDCDGDLDIAAGGSVYRHDGGTWSLSAMVDASQISQLADMNGDGHLDLVTQDPSVGLALYLGDGAGAFSFDASAELPGADDTSHGAAMDSAYGIAIGDLDGNDALDIVRIAGYGGPYYVDVLTR